MRTTRSRWMDEDKQRNETQTHGSMMYDKVRTEVFIYILLRMYLRVVGYEGFRTSEMGTVKES